MFLITGFWLERKFFFVYPLWIVFFLLLKGIYFNTICIPKVSNETTVKYKSSICEASLGQYTWSAKAPVVYFSTEPSVQEFIYITCLWNAFKTKTS